MIARQPLPFHVSEARQSLQERETWIQETHSILMKNSIYQEGGELDTPTTLWFCENLPLWEGFILGFGPAYGWAGLKPLPNKAMNDQFIQQNSFKSVACMHLFHKNVSFRNICCWPGRVHYVHGHISCNGHASTFCHTNSSGRCHCCRRDDGSVEEEVGVPGVLMNWSFSPHLFNDFKGCHFASGNSLFG